MTALVAQELASIFPGTAVHEFGRGSTGLYHLFAVLRHLRGPGEVIIPSLCCETVALAAIFAGHRVRCADVDRERFCVSAASVAAEMNPNTRAVVVAHLFGLHADTQSFETLRRSAPGVVFVEDLAHAVGGRDHAGNDLGRGLDYAMFSFSPSKILGGSGGALLGTEDREIFPRLAVQATQYAPNANIGLLGLSLRNLVHSIADLHRSGSTGAAKDLAESMWLRFTPVVAESGSFRDAQQAVIDLRRRDAIRAVRRTRAERYRVGITHPGFRVPPFSAQETCWRVPVIAETPGLTRRATAALRAEGLHASNHYFPLHRLFGNAALPSAEYVGDRLLNLWVDETITDHDLAATCAILNSL